MKCFQFDPLKVPCAEGVEDAGHVFVAVHLLGTPGHWCLLVGIGRQDFSSFFPVT